MAYYPLRNTATSFFGPGGNTGVGIDNYLYNDCVLSGFEVYSSAGLKLQDLEGLNEAVLWGKRVTYNDLVTNTVWPDSTVANSRYDAAVLKLDFTTSSVTFALIKGTEAAVPDYPAVTNTADLKYLLLAYVHIPHPFTKNVTAVVATDIQDMRVMAPKPALLAVQYASRENLIFNPELAVYSSAGGTATVALPEGWELNAGACVVTRELNSTGDSCRGFVCKFRGNTGGLIRTHAIAPPLSHSNTATAINAYTPLSVSARIKLESGKTVALRLQRRQNTSWMTVKETYYRYNATTASWFNATLRGITNNNYVNALRIEVEDLTLATANYIYFSFVSCTFGNVPIQYAKKSEIIYFKNEVVLPGYSLVDTHSTDAVNITEADVAAVTYDARFLILRVLVKDSGSAAGTCGVSFNGTLTTGIAVECTNNPNNHYVEQIIYVPVGTDTVMFDIRCTATGANTMVARVSVIGAIT